jgi:molybdenum cofactor guanylyltransferase
MIMPSQLSPAFSYDALILAGGKGSRMGGRDKAWVMWRHLPLIEHVLARLNNQTVKPLKITISANRNLDAYEHISQAVLADERDGNLGPLAGIEAALIRCKQPLMMVTPCDAPLIPLNMVERLYEALLDQPEAFGTYVMTDDGPQPLCCLLRPQLSPALSKFLDQGRGKVTDWFALAGVIPVSFKEADAFMNFNDLHILQATEAQQ